MIEKGYKESLDGLEFSLESLGGLDCLGSSNHQSLSSLPAANHTLVNCLLKQKGLCS